MTRNIQLQYFAVWRAHAHRFLGHESLPRYPRESPSIASCDTSFIIFWKIRSSFFLVCDCDKKKISLVPKKHIYMGCINVKLRLKMCERVTTLRIRGKEKKWNVNLCRIEYMVNVFFSFFQNPVLGFLSHIEKVYLNRNVLLFKQDLPWKPKY